MNLGSLLKRLLRPHPDAGVSIEEQRHALVGPPELWKMKREFQIKFLRDMGLRPDQDLLDIGCGTLRGGIPLIDFLEEGRYVGFEIRQEVLEEGRRELKDAELENKNPELLHASGINELSTDRQFDFIWAFSVLFHMEDDILHDTLEFVSGHLKEDGVFYANVNFGENRQNRWQGFPEIWRTLAFYQDVCSRHGLAVTDLGSLGSLGHDSNDAAQDAQHMLRIVVVI